jgi:hypothetical protein
MSTTNRVSETREVVCFTRVTLRAQNMENDLVIRQGEPESLIIEANQELLSRIKTVVRDGELAISIDGSWSDKVKEALATSLTRQVIKYTLTVKKLTALDIAGIAHVKAGNIETDRLALRLFGPGSISFVSLIAGLLEVDLTGGCQVNLKGKVAEQKITIGAMGIYNAPDLESKKAVARLGGPGKVTVWVTEDLDVTISGPGSLEYYGAPKVKRNISPLGSVVSLGAR